jgi:two-component system, NarL family, sensor histidine kinase LiaS
MKGGIFSLRRLRWKLTFSYTLVTVVALLSLQLLMVGALVAFLESPFLASLVAQQMRASLVPQLEEPLDAGNPDRARIREELDIFAQNSDVQGAGQGADGRSGPEDIPNFRDTVTPDQGALFVLDEQRELVASMPRLEGFAEGRRFDAGRIEGLEPLVDRALNSDGQQNYSANTPDSRVLAVVPVEDGEGRLTGVLVGTLRLPNLTAPLLITVGVGAVLLTIPAAVLGLVFGFVTAWGITRRIGRLARAAKAWSRGDFSVTTKDRSRDELGQLSRELNQMAVDVENLLQARGELATLEARNRFARDLHDSVKQQVFAVSLQIAAARAMIQKDTDSAESHLSQADDLVRQAQKELNILIAEMRPAALEGKGLATALREYVARWSEGAEIPADFRVRGEREAPLEVEQAIFRVAQEALANVARHSGAGHAEVDLSYTDKDLTLRIADDGRGFDPTRGSGGGFGLQSMRERLVRLGGRIDVDSAPNKGTRVEAVCPFHDPSKEEKTP